MIQKPKIQYIGQFYTYGSEARQIQPEEEKRQAKTRLPLARMEKIEKIYVDPVALVGIAVAVVMLVVMALGAMQLQQDWAEYRQMSGYVSQLRQENAKLTRQYRESYDLDEIRVKAAALGMIPKEEAESMTVVVTIPQPEPEPGRLERVVEFLEGLFA